MPMFPLCKYRSVVNEFVGPTEGLLKKSDNMKSILRPQKGRNISVAVFANGVRVFNFCGSSWLTRCTISRIWP